MRAAVLGVALAFVVVLLALTVHAADQRGPTCSPCCPSSCSPCSGSASSARCCILRSSERGRSRRRGRARRARRRLRRERRQRARPARGAATTRPAPRRCRSPTARSTADPGRPPLRLKLPATADPSGCASSTSRAAACSSTSTPARSCGAASPTRVLPIASADEDDDRAASSSSASARRDKVRVTKEALAYKGSGVGVLPARQAGQARDDALRPAAAVGQRRGDRAGPARRAARSSASSRG